MDDLNHEELKGLSIPPNLPPHSEKLVNPLNNALLAFLESLEMRILQLLVHPLPCLVHLGLLLSRGLEGDQAIVKLRQDLPELLTLIIDNVELRF